MNKLFLSIATSAICLTGMAPQAQAAPAWANQSANETCRFLRQGYSPEEAGEKAAEVVLEGRNSGQMIAAYKQGTLKPELASVLIKACPSDLIKASRRSSF